MHFDNVGYEIVGWLKAKKSLGLGWGRRKASLSLFLLSWVWVWVGGKEGGCRERIGTDCAAKESGKAGSALGYACAKLHPHFLASRAPGTSRFGVGTLGTCTQPLWPILNHARWIRVTAQGIRLLTLLPGSYTPT